MFVARPLAEMVKNLPAIQETRLRSLGQEDPPEKGMAIYSSILAWRIPGTEVPGRLESMGLPRVRLDSATAHTCRDGPAPEACGHCRALEPS